MPQRPSRLVDGLAWAGIALLVGLAADLLLGPPLRGIADNGDAHRVMAPAGLGHTAPIDEFRHAFVRRDYRLVPPRTSVVPSSGVVLARIGRALPFPGVRRGHADLRQFGLVHGAVALAFVALALRRRVEPAKVLVFCLTMATPEVVLGWNGLHPDVAATLGFFGLGLGLLRARPGSRASTWIEVATATSLAIAGCLVGASSRAYVLVPLVAAFAIASGRPRTLDLGARRVAIFLVASSLGALALFELGPGPRFSAINDFNAVYRGLAEVADDPPVVLAELGLPSSSLSLVGHSYFDVEVPQDVTRSLERMSHARVAFAYLRRPRAMMRATRRMAIALADPRKIFYGSFEKTPEHPRQTPPERGFCLRALRTSLGSPWLGVGLVLLTAGLIVAAPAGSKFRARFEGLRTFFVFASLLVVVQSTVALLGDGLFSLRRHLLLPSLALDAMFGLMLLEAARSLFTRIAERLVDRRADGGRAPSAVGSR